MSETKRRYERPCVAADIVLFGFGPAGLQVLLIQRGTPPFEGLWALPGGHVEPNEEPRLSAIRELAEETGLTDLPLLDLAVFGAPGRDPRGWYISAAFLGVTLASDVIPEAADDAADVAWHSVRNLPELAFDHAAIIARGLVELGSRRPQVLDPLPVLGTGPELVLASGVTAAGKSTLCRELVAAVPSLTHLDLDQIRRDLTANKPTYSHPEAWASHNATRSLAEWLLAAGHGVVVDVSGLTASDRAHYLNSGPLFGSRTTLVWCETDQATALARLEHRAAGLDPLDHSSAKMEFWTKSLARRELPSLAEADVIVKVTPQSHDAALAELTTRLDRGR